MIRVLMIVPNLRVSNGVVSFVMNYYRNVVGNDIRIDLALYDDIPSPYYKELKKNSKIYILPPIKKLREHIAVCNKVMDEKYDVVHDNLMHISIPMMWCAKRKGVPVRILHSHNAKMGETFLKEVRNKFFLPVLRGLATDFVSCSELAGKAMFKNREFIVLPNVIQTDKYHFDENVRTLVRKKMNTTDKFVVGTVGRLADQKNPFFAMDVFECLQKQVPNAEYWWVGSGSLDDQVKAYVEKKGLSGKVKLLGSRNDIVDLYQGMDVFFLPSLFEGLPVTGVEAQAMGLPMVVSDSITKEMVYTDLVDYVDLKELKEVWAKHLEDTMGKKIERSKYAEQLKYSEFSNYRCGKNLLYIYIEMLKKNWI